MKEYIKITKKGEIEKIKLSKKEIKKAEELFAEVAKTATTEKTKPKKPRKPQTGLIAFNILCKDKEEREELQNLIWMLKYRMYESRGSTALLKLLKANHVSQEADRGRDPKTA